MRFDKRYVASGIGAAGWMVVALILAVIVPVSVRGDAPGFTHSRYSAERMIDESFDVRSDGLLRVDVGDMDVYIRNGDDGGVHVEVFTAGPNEDRAREYFERANVSVDRNGNDVILKSRESHFQVRSFWTHFRHVRIWAVVTVPRKTNANISTSDGDLQIDDLEGDVKIHTSDGDIVIGSLGGPAIDIDTSDGDITLGDLKAKTIEVSTSDGDLEAQNIEAEMVSMSTSDGDVTIKEISGENINVRTSDGDIDIGATGGSLRVRCADGDMRVRLFSEMEVDLSSQDGDIDIQLPKSVGADLDLRGDDVSISSSIALKGNVSERRVVGSINSGGPSIRAKTSDGSIVVRGPRG